MTGIKYKLNETSDQKYIQCAEIFSFFSPPKNIFFFKYSTAPKKNKKNIYIKLGHYPLI